MPSSTGWTFGSSRPNFAPSFRSWSPRNEHTRYRGARKRCAGIAAVFSGCASAGPRRRRKGGGTRVGGNRKPRAGTRQGCCRDLVGGLPCPCGERIVRRGFFQSHREGARVLQDTGDCVARRGGTLRGVAAAEPRAVAADF